MKAERFIPMVERVKYNPPHLHSMKGWISLLLFLAAQTAQAQQSAAPYSFEWEVVSVNGIPGMATARLHLKLVNPTDYLTSISGWDGMDGRVETTTSFYQDEDGWATPNNNNPLLFDLLPSLRFDSWVTIGIDVAPDGAAGEIPVGVFPPGTGSWVEDFEEGNDLVMDEDGAWFVTLGSTNGTAGENLKVMVGQFTTDGVISGQLNVQVFSEGVSSADFMDDIYSILIPEFDAGLASGMATESGDVTWEIRQNAEGYQHKIGQGCFWKRLDSVGRELEVGWSEFGDFQTIGGGFVCVWLDGDSGFMRRWLP